MSNFPCELLDHFVDLLHDSQTPLRNCCLVSKSWIPRARRHLFAKINFQTAENLESWKKTFPDPSTSPARYAKALLIGIPEVVTVAGSEAGAWIAGFSGVEHLELGGHDPDALEWEVVFVLFRGFSPVKSLYMKYSFIPFPYFFDLALSFPLLEDLVLADCYDVPADNGGDSDGLLAILQPPSLPVFTGCLNIVWGGGMKSTVHWLLSLPSAIHFRKLNLTWSGEEDISLTVALVERCSRTLESLSIFHDLRIRSSCIYIRTSNLLPFPDEPRSASLDPSKATRVRDVVFRPGLKGVEWITLTLQTIGQEHRDLRRISIFMPLYSTLIPIGKGTLEQWLDLDRTLVNLWESHSISLRVLRPGGQVRTAECIGPLLLEMTRRGRIELVG